MLSRIFVQHVLVKYDEGTFGPGNMRLRQRYKVHNWPCGAYNGYWASLTHSTIFQERWQQ